MNKKQMRNSKYHIKQLIQDDLYHTVNNDEWDCNAQCKDLPEQLQMTVGTQTCLAKDQLCGFK